MPATAALIVAGGRAERFGGDRPKQYCELGGMTMLRRAVLTFRAHPAIDHVLVVAHEQDRAAYDRAVGDLDLPAPAPAGASRQDSVRGGLQRLQRSAAAAGLAPERVLIHDAARPLLPAALIDRVLAALDGAPAALPVLAIQDTLRRARRDGLTETVPRDGLMRAQTPQGFHFGAILAAHEALAGREMTDDAALAEAAGLPVAMVAGEAAAEKITTAADLERAQAELRGRAAARDGAQDGEMPMETRTGSGFDVHAFTAGDHVMLCGVPVPHERALAGHSDADPGLHALTDAILGALAEGDIGTHFPPSDPQWRDADSARFVEFAAARVAAAGGLIRHVDVTVICERPRIGPHRPAMTARIAEILGLAPGRVSVKATTSEGLGFAGRGEGIACQAVATLALPAAALPAAPALSEQQGERDDGL